MSTDDKNKIPGNVIPDHAYDGIEELDNPLPSWWLQVFWGTIIFAVGYFAYYQFMGGQSIEQELAADVKAHEELFAASQKAGPSADDLNNMASDSGSMEKGKTEYLQKCAACHAADGGGGIGPNLADDYWLHGDGSNSAIYAVIAKGILAKGMPAWEQVMGADDMKSVVQFIASFKGTTPASPKPPQGDLRK